MAVSSSLGPVITQNNDVIIVQLPFDFETLFTQPKVSHVHTVVATTQPAMQPAPRVPDESAARSFSELHPRYRRRAKSRKTVFQHLEELASPCLRLADNGRELFCVPCDMELTEGGKVKKSSIKLHLTCKRHMFNIKQQEKKASLVPGEVHYDEGLGLYKCMLCGKAISNDPHDVKRHCGGKRHVRLLEARNGVPFSQTEFLMAVSNSPTQTDQMDAEGEEAGEALMESVKPLSARDYNNEFVYDVLDFIMRTNNQLSAIKHMKKLLTKWTAMKLPNLEAIRRNHLQKYLNRNPDVRLRREQAAARRLAKRQVREDIDEGMDLGDGVIQQEDQQDDGTVSTMELEQAMHAAFAVNEQIFSVSEYAIQSVVLNEELSSV